MFIYLNSREKILIKIDDSHHVGLNTKLKKIKIKLGWIINEEVLWGHCHCNSRIFFVILHYIFFFFSINPLDIIKI